MSAILLELFGKGCQLAHLHDCFPPQFLLSLLACWRPDVRRLAIVQDQLTISLRIVRGSDLLGDSFIHQELAMGLRARYQRTI